jgi:hypothetical protein
MNHSKEAISDMFLRQLKDSYYGQNHHVLAVAGMSVLIDTFDALPTDLHDILSPFVEKKVWTSSDKEDLVKAIQEYNKAQLSPANVQESSQPVQRVVVQTEVCRHLRLLGQALLPYVPLVLALVSLVFLLWGAVHMFGISQEKSPAHNSSAPVKFFRPMHFVQQSHSSSPNSLPLQRQNRSSLLSRIALEHMYLHAKILAARKDTENATAANQTCQADNATANNETGTADNATANNETGTAEDIGTNEASTTTTTVGFRDVFSVLYHSYAVVSMSVMTYSIILVRSGRY